LSTFYSNITLKGPAQADLLEFLNAQGDVAYVSPEVKGAVIVFHEDMSKQENLAARLSWKFDCPALLVMVYGQAVLLYHLYQDGKQADAYVSSPHGDLELDGDPPPGDAAILCAAFEAERFERRVESILRKEAKPGQPYEYAANRHGELFRALGLPLFGVGVGFPNIDVGEMPAGEGFDPSQMMRTK
jgi:hypothetical protein